MWLIPHNQNIRDQFIQSDELRRRLLAANDLTLEKAIRIAVAHESLLKDIA